jgi:hypothetical protein
MWKTDSKRLKEVEEALERLQRDWKAIRGEWDDAYDRMMKLVGRFSKRAQWIEQKEREAELAAGESDTPGGSTTDTSAVDNFAHLDPISRRIMERRHRIGQGARIPREEVPK